MLIFDNGEVKISLDKEGDNYSMRIDDCFDVIRVNLTPAQVKEIYNKLYDTL